MSELENLSVADLTRRMIAHELFVIQWTPIVPFDELLPLLKDHFLYLIDLEKKNILFASGPLINKNEEMKGAGMTIVRAQSYEDAEEVARNDPFVKAGMRTSTVHKWVMNEGRISLSLDLSDGTVKLG